jgi:superfamily II DNA/RNA helicase
MSSSFADFGVPTDLVGVLAARGIDRPFPIQEATLPDALAGRDVIGRAPTGSGKTIAFGLAVADRVAAAKPGRPTALILAPTRELADQIRRELEPLAAARGRRVAAVYGGTGYGAQTNALRRGVDVLVACPGRLEDLIQRGDVTLRDVGIVVLDEADRMADMGFMPAMRRILDQVRDDRQTLLFSATLDGEVDKLARAYQRDPARHASEPEARSTGDVRHLVWRVKSEDRVDLLIDLVLRTGTVIAFCRTRHGVDRLAKRLNKAGVGAANLHGARSQSQRERALHAFTTGRLPVLVATDVAARGIHVDQVACVVHFDPPADPADYVHRSGRTGRAGEDGLVVSFVGKQDEHAARKLIGRLGLDAAIEPVDLDMLGPVRPVSLAPVPEPAAPAQKPNDVSPSPSRRRRRPRPSGQGPGTTQRPRGKARRKSRAPVTV